MAISLDGPRVPPAKGPADRLVVFVHGYGADGNDLIGLGGEWQRLLPTAAFVSPNGPQPCEGAPMGRQWFPISRLDPAEMVRGVESAAPILNAFIDAELARLNLDASRLSLVGFSGVLTGPEKLLNEIQSKPPVLLIHGDEDPMIPVQALYMSANGLAGAGVPVRWHVSRGIGHGIGPDGLELGGKFLVDAYAGKLSAGGGTAPVSAKSAG